MTIMQRLFSRIKEDYLLCVLLLLFPILLWLSPTTPYQIADLVNWHTISALAGLMLLSKALEDSGYLIRFAAWLLLLCHNQRVLAAVLIVFAAMLSAVVTNDVALFILVPITLSIGRLTKMSVGRLIIFLALAVNAGSSLSPIGNPQNLLLWQASGYSFLEFTAMMAPLALALMALILLLSFFAFSKQKQEVSVNHATDHDNKRLFVYALIGYPLFIIAIEYQLSPIVALAIFALYLCFKRSVVLGIDWFLLLVFAFMFIDLGLLAKLAWLEQLALNLTSLNHGSYLGSAFLSQLISNVPAAIFLQHFTEEWRALSWGVSVGGFGFAIGSLANLIALRLAKNAQAGEVSIWKEFHCWSLPIFIVSLALGWLLL